MEGRAGAFRLHTHARSICNNSCSQSLFNRRHTPCAILGKQPRQEFSTSIWHREPHSKAPESRYSGASRKKSNDRLKNTLRDRDLVFSVLNASTTKRDAKSYLSRFNGQISNLQHADHLAKVLHLSIVKIRAPQDLEDNVMEGLATTLSQLDRLGLSLIIVLDQTSAGTRSEISDWRQAAVTQAERLVSALEQNKSIRARKLDFLLSVSSPNQTASTAVSTPADLVRVAMPEALRECIIRGTIPVVPCIGYAEDTQLLTFAPPSEVLLALTRAITDSTIQNKTTTSSIGETSPSGFNALKPMVIDRILLLDPLGPLPASSRADKTHIFVNLEQEYAEIKRDLATFDIDKLSSTHPHASKRGWTLSASSPNTRFWESEALAGNAIALGTANRIELDRSSIATQHVINLDLIRNALNLLPSAASAMITTPLEAATLPQQQDDADPDVRTRRPKNPLIFNLLTDKPLVSSSLPASRMNRNFTGKERDGALAAVRGTFIKKGMPVTVVPDPLLDPWTPPDSATRHLTLDDPRIDFPRLWNLIEDSFNRPLDVDHYLARVKGKIAGIIVAGDYEGGAILTWELPPGVPDDNSDESRQRMVPYLDKFAVLKRSQGAGGVADIVFTAMVRGCFPNGVCWRSRKDNPVNKWYFERSIGTKKLSDSNWTMFWTTEDLYQDKLRLGDYEAVCRSVQPSWADKKHIVD